MTTFKEYSDQEFRKRLKKEYKGHLIIGITGHRDLLASDGQGLQNKEDLKLAVEQKLKKLAGNKPVLLVSGLAMGADQLVPETIDGVPAVVLCVPLTMTPYDYIESGFTGKKDGKMFYYEAERDYFNDKVSRSETVVVKLYEDSLYGGRERLTDKERDRQYEELGKFMTRYCDHLVALWDGVDGGGIGGTSDVVRMMVQGKSLMGGKIEQKKTQQYLHQYVVPREKNRFSIGRRFIKEQLNWPTGAPYTWVDSPLQNRHKSWWRVSKQAVDQLPIWYWLIGVVTGSLAALDTAKTWYIRPDITPAIYQNIIQDAKTWGIVLSLYILFGLAYLLFSRGRDVLLQFAIPIVLAICVLGLGTYGFYEGCLGNSVDSFFGAANLITLNTSVFSGLGTPEQPIIMNPWLKTARILGGFLAGYAFILAFALATGRENVGRFLFFLHRPMRYVRKLFTGFRLLWPEKPSPSLKQRWWQRLGTFGVVLGNGTMAINVAIDMARNNRQRVALLANDVDATTLSLLNASRVWVFQGKITSRTALQKTVFWEASAVYVISDSDEDNFRCAQELDELYVLKHKSSWLRRWVLADRRQKLLRLLPKRWQESIRTDRKPNWYVHQQNSRQRALLQRIARQYLRSFSVSENTARRLLFRYPIDRFREGESSVAEVAVLGFGQLGQDIALACLRLGHYTPGKHLHLTVFYRPDEETTVESFRNSHPELFKNRSNAGLFSQGSYQQQIQQYTFFTRQKATPNLTGLLPTELRNWLWDLDQPVIEFQPLPTAESELVNPAFLLYDTIQSGRVVSIYVCQPTGLESASLLGSILPRIEWLKRGQPSGNCQLDVQVFCSYNFPDPDEEQYVEMKLNSLASYVPVVCFGNYLYECSVDAIKNESLNQVARQIALLYACLYGDDVVNEMSNLRDLLDQRGFSNKQQWSSDDNEANIEKTKVLLPELLAMKTNKPNAFFDWLEICWENLKEIDRESNIQAADHAWVKLRLLNPCWDQVAVDTFLPSDQLALLSEVEHRRWNAEKLLLGWLPQQDSALWKTHKVPLRDQKSHQFLMTFKNLPDKEKNKDYTQVLGLPYFFME